MGTVMNGERPMSVAACPPGTALEQLYEGQLAPDAVATLEAHVQGCDTCARQLATLLDGATAWEARLQADVAVPNTDEVAALVADFKTRWQQTPSLSKQSAPTNSIHHYSAHTPSTGTPIVLDDELAGMLAPPQHDDEVGRLGTYRILHVLGRGGMGVVFLAEDSQLRRRVALKAMLPHVAANPLNRQRFRREAEAMAAVTHDHVARVYQIDEDRGIPFLAMEYLQGTTLEDRLFHEPTLPLVEVVRLGAEMAEGLHAAHATNLVHRDVKPSNVWLEAPANRVKILDFGIARPATADVRCTQQGTIIGTPAYMAPEQGRGGPVDARSDLFSLGIILYEMTTGQLPFPVTDMVSTLLAINTVVPAKPRSLRPAIPAPLDKLIVKLLEKDADRRPATAHAVAQELRAIETAMRSERGPTRSRRRPFAFALAGLAMLLALVIGGVFYIVGNHGTIKVEVLSDDIEVVLTATGATLKDRHSELTVKPGKHKLVVRSGDLEFETAGFDLKRGEQVLVKAEWLEGQLQAVTADGRVLGTATKPLPAENVRSVIAFDGLDSYASFPTVVANGFDTMTIEVWALNDQNEFRAHLKTTTGAWQLFRTETALRCTYAEGISGQGVMCEVEWPKEGWSHLVAQCRNNTMQLFRNGQPLKGVPVRVGLPRSGKWTTTIGNTDLPAKRLRPMAGTIAGLRFSSSARYSDAFVPPIRFENDKDTLAVYHFDEGQGKVIYDHSDHKHHGTLVGGKWQQLAFPAPAKAAP